MSLLDPEACAREHPRAGEGTSQAICPTSEAQSRCEGWGRSTTTSGEPLHRVDSRATGQEGNMLTAVLYDLKINVYQLSTDVEC